MAATVSSDAYDLINTPNLKGVLVLLAICCFDLFLVYVHLVLFPLVFYQKDIDLHKIQKCKLLYIIFQSFPECLFG